LRLSSLRTGYPSRIFYGSQSNHFSACNGSTCFLLVATLSLIVGRFQFRRLFPSNREMGGIYPTSL
jgi:hypothetical protein